MGDLFVIAAASGTGKTTLARALIERTPNLIRSVSHTTRPPRPGERDGVDYRFVANEVFEAMHRRGEFLEQAEVFGHQYGTSRLAVSSALAAGQDVALVIDWQGYRQLRAALPSTVGVFLLPPSRAELERRLRGRGQDTEEVVRHRLARAQGEITHWREFDYVVVNRDFDEALADLQAIVRARRLSRDAQASAQAALLRELRAEDRQSR